MKYSPLKNAYVFRTMDNNDVIIPTMKSQEQDIIEKAKLILKHNKENEILLGQKFNIFSILKMERSENATHSAFLAELLNPEGTHLKGSIFLELFVKSFSIDPFDVDSAKVTPEFPIGNISKDFDSGGRIDIFIQDKRGCCISIENKIDANDQEKQIARYCAYKQDKNKVFYLTLDGRKPSDFSKSNLESDKDFFCISYQTDIRNWLNLCLKECVDQPILRESIRQYIFLINKMTNIMNNEEMKDLDSLILSNAQAVTTLSSNLNRVLEIFREEIRDHVIRHCQEILGKEYIVKKGNKISDLYAQIWISHEELDPYHCIFGIESFSGRGNLNGEIFVGLLKDPKYNESDPCPYLGRDGEGEFFTKVWPRIK